MTKLCKYCGKRRVKQQEWKTAEEKEACFTCLTFFDACGSMVQVLNKNAEEKGVKLTVGLYFTPKDGKNL